MIKDELAGGKDIFIRVYQLPVIARDRFDAELHKAQELNTIFESTRIMLAEKIKEILF
ncbi:MAG: hypothetical protein KAR21_23260 [Spirochaetales bacterium]|nr:hypothetical protein [Spirochaetales bacterium]